MRRQLLPVLVGMLVCATAAEAQRRGGPASRAELRESLRGRAVPEIGIRGAYDFDQRDFGVGGQLRVPLGRFFELAPSGDVFFGEERTWQANGDVAVSLILLRGGLGLAVVDPVRLGDEGGDPEIGLNLFAGLQAPPRRGRWVRPYAEARWTFLESPVLFRLAAGANLLLGDGRR